MKKKKKKPHIHTIAAFIFAQSPGTLNKIHADVRILLRFSAASAEEEEDDADWSSLPTPGCDPKLQLRTKPDPETRLRKPASGQPGSADRDGLQVSGSPAPGCLSALQRCLPQRQIIPTKHNIRPLLSK